MLLRLIETTSDPAFSGEGWVRLLGAAWEDEDVALRLSVSRGEAEDEVWEVRCSNVRAQRITTAGADHLRLLDDHVLLWPHAQPQLRLAFRGTVKDPHALFGALLDEHERIVGPWFAALEFLSPETTALDLLRQGLGILAVGPQKILEKYREVALAHGLECGLSILRPAEDARPRALFLGDSFWVAEGFDAERV